MGGTFNPAHKGHLNITRFAVKNLNLSQAWWMVTPQNPLKKLDVSKTVHLRINNAKVLAQDPKIRIGSPELRIHTKYTYDTLFRLKLAFPKVKFIWLIGADNLCTMHKWYNWKKIFYLTPIVVLDRPGYSNKAITSKASKYFWSCKIKNNLAKNITNYKLPAWAFVKVKPDHTSSTFIRNINKKKLGL